jgi:hypothetical protein
MSADDFERIKREFGTEANIMQEQFLILKDDEADQLISRVTSFADKANLRLFRKRGKLVQSSV